MEGGVGKNILYIPFGKETQSHRGKLAIAIPEGTIDSELFGHEGIFYRCG
jgi:hypothetical protein